VIPCLRRARLRACGPCEEQYGCKREGDTPCSPRPPPARSAAISDSIRSVKPWHLIPLALFIVPGFLLLWRIRRCGSEKAGKGKARPFSVIVPARNEERRLPPLLESLRGQTLAPTEVLVVDDGSTDATGVIASRAGCRVIPAGEKPAGWLGKSWACWTGAQNAQTGLLMFLDADTVLRPDGCRRILAERETFGGLLSVQPWHRTGSAREKLSLFFNLIVMAALNSFTAFGERLRPAGSFGPCIMCGRQEYFSVGGHESVKGSILEDIDLGRRFQAAGISVQCRGGAGVIEFRMYPGGISEQVEGWSKNMARGAQGTHPLVLSLAFLWIAGCTAASALFLRGLFSFVPADFSLSAAFYLLYAGQLFWMARRAGNFGLFACLAYPVHLLFFFFVFVRSLVSTFFFRSVSWKGRKIQSPGHEEAPHRLPRKKEYAKKTNPRREKL
jgi:4,4'-diaponeurosporenoate glycosyltransferase